MIPDVPWPPGLATTFVETSKYGGSVGWFHGGRYSLVLEVCSQEISSCTVVVFVVVKQSTTFFVGSFIAHQYEFSIIRVGNWNLRQPRWSDNCTLGASWDRTTECTAKSEIYYWLIMTFQSKWHRLESNNWGIVRWEFFVALGDSFLKTTNTKTANLTTTTTTLYICNGTFSGGCTSKYRLRRGLLDCVRRATDAISWPHFVWQINAATFLVQRLIWVYVC